MNSIIKQLESIKEEELDLGDWTAHFISLLFKKKEKKEGIGIFTFSLGSERFGMEVSFVKEVVRTSDLNIQKPPDKEGIVVANLRGETVEVIIPEVVIGEDYKSNKDFFLVFEAEGTCGIFLDPPFSILRIESMKDLLPVKGIDEKLVKGELGGEEPVVILDPLGLCRRIG